MDDPQTKTTSFRRFGEIEGLRAILAWWVVFAHILASGGFQSEDLVWPFSVLRVGAIAVDGFMIVSGFVIAHLVLRKNESYFVYLTRRFLRLFPLFIVVCAIALGVEFALGITSSDYATEKWPMYLAINATMLHGLIPNEVLRGASHAIITPGWSISLEWQFYLVAPLLVGVAGSRGLLPRVLGLLLFVVLIVLNLRDRTDLPYTYPHASVLLFSLHYFIIGMLSYLLLSKVEQIPADIGSATTVLLCLVAFAFTRDYALALWVVVFCGLVSQGTVGTRRRIISSRLLTHLGKISFSTYLCHYIVVSIVGHFLFKRGFAWADYGFILASAALVVPATYLASVAMHRFIEAPFIALGKTLLENSASKLPDPARVTD